MKVVQLKFVHIFGRDPNVCRFLRLYFPARISNPVRMLYINLCARIEKKSLAPNRGRIGKIGGALP